MLLLASAIDRRFLAPSGRYGLAPSSVEQFTNLINRNDPVLKRLHLVAHDRRVVAAGTAGIPSSGWAADSLVQFDVSRQVGHSHRLTAYLDSPTARWQLRQLLLPSPTTSEVVAVDAEPSR